MVPVECLFWYDSVDCSFAEVRLKVSVVPTWLGPEDHAGPRCLMSRSCEGKNSGRNWEAMTVDYMNGGLLERLDPLVDLRVPELARHLAWQLKVSVSLGGGEGQVAMMELRLGPCLEIGPMLLMAGARRPLVLRRGIWFGRRRRTYVYMRSDFLRRMYRCSC